MACNIEAASALGHHVERGARRQDLAQIRDLGHRFARGPVSFDVAMQAGIRYLRHGNGNAPCIVFLSHGCASASPGDGNSNNPPHNPTPPTPSPPPTPTPPHSPTPRAP